MILSKVGMTARLLNVPNKISEIKFSHNSLKRKFEGGMDFGTSALLEKRCSNQSITWGAVENILKEELSGFCSTI